MIVSQIRKSGPYTTNMETRHLSNTTSITGATSMTKTYRLMIYSACFLVIRIHFSQICSAVHPMSTILTWVKMDFSDRERRGGIKMQTRSRGTPSKGEAVSHPCFSCSPSLFWCFQGFLWISLEKIQTTLLPRATHTTCCGELSSWRWSTIQVASSRAS